MSNPIPYPSMCVVTRGRGTSGSDERLKLIGRLSAAARSGADIIQIRERHFDDRTLLQFAREVIAAVRPLRARVVINERTDIALASGADGMHLKSDGPAVADVRGIVPAGFLIGRSVHADWEARAVEDAGGCDYLFFGTVFQSASKPDDHPLAGIEGLRTVCRNVSMPVIAIGGISVARAADVRQAGAAGVAAISLFAETPDIAGLTASIRDALTPPSRNV